MSTENTSPPLESLRNLGDLATLLKTSRRTLLTSCRIIGGKSLYSEFKISKRSGGKRTISAPNQSLKFLQRTVAGILETYYTPPGCVYGFIKGGSIISNARVHSRQRYVFNLDLKDFFPSINLGRIRGLLQSLPFNCQPRIATMLANICCHDNALPQGAPTSPILSNMICLKMDLELQALARRLKCQYTRYADDITFSCNRHSFPTAFAQENADGSWVTADKLVGIIEGNGFSINKAKVRMQTFRRRQMVTGLVTNTFPNVPRTYVRQVQSMLHSWEKFGLEKAEEHFHAKPLNKHRKPGKGHPRFDQVLLGKILFIYQVKGPDSSVSCELKERICRLKPQYWKAFKTYTPLPAMVANSIAGKASIETRPALLAEVHQGLDDILRRINRLRESSLAGTDHHSDRKRHEELIKNIKETILPLIGNVLPISDNGHVAAEIGPRWNQLSPDTRGMLSRSKVLASSGLKEWLHLAIIELCGAIELEIYEAVFRQLDAPILSPPPLPDKKAQLSHDILAKYVAGKHKLTLGEYAWFIKSAQEFPEHGLFKILLSELKKRYPVTNEDIQDRIKKLYFAQKGEIRGLSKSIVDIRNAAVHPVGHAGIPLTVQTHKAIWEYALREPLELLLLLTEQHSSKRSTSRIIPNLDIQETDNLQEDAPPDPERKH